MNANGQVYIAVCKWGFGIDEVAAVAVARCQLQIPDDARRLEKAQLLIYKGACGAEPTGFGQWKNGSRPKLAGITNCAQKFSNGRRPRNGN